MLKKCLLNIHEFVSREQSQCSFFEKYIQEAKTHLESKNLDQICISLNGGKDSTVVFFLSLYLLLGKDAELANSSILCVYLKEKDPFPEVLEYLNQLKKECPIEFKTYNSNSEVNTDFIKKVLDNLSLFSH